MINAKPAISVLFSATLVLCSFCGFAQIVDVSECRAMADRTKRLDCYESREALETSSEQRASPQSRPAQTELTNNSPAVAQPVATDQQAPVTNTVSNTNQDQAKPDRTSTTDNVQLVESKNSAAERIDTVAAIEERQLNVALITLKSGQKWLQMISKRYPLEEGDEVRIYPSGFGDAYRLTATRMSGFIQVKRIQ